MSMIFNILSSGGISPVVLQHFPLETNLADTKHGAPAAFDRASNKFAYNAETNRMQWYAEDVPQFTAAGLLIEQSNTSQFSDGWTLSTGWTGGEHSSALSQVSYVDPTGVTRNGVSVFDNNSNLMTAARNQGVSVTGQFKLGAIFQRTSAFTDTQWFGFYVYSGSNRRSIYLNFADMSVVTGAAGSAPVTFDPASLTYTYLFNDWWMIEVTLTKGSTSAVSWVISSSTTINTKFRIGAAWLQYDLRDTPVISQGTATTRAADELSLPIAYSDNTSLYMELQFRKRWDSSPTIRITIAIGAYYGFALGISRDIDDGVAWLDVQYAPGQAFSYKTTQPFDLVLANPVKVMCRFKSLSTTEVALQLVYKVGDMMTSLETAWTDEEYFPVSKTDLTFSTLTLRSNGAFVGVPSADIALGRTVKNVKKLNTITMSLEDAGSAT